MLHVDHELIREVGKQSARTDSEGRLDRVIEHPSGSVG